MAKGKGFDRLRIAAATAGTLVAGLLGGASRSARAADAPMPIDVVAAGASWLGITNAFGFFVNCQGGSNGPGAKPDGKGGPGTRCLGIAEASFINPARTDGLDGALSVAVNGTGFINPDGTLDLTGTTVTSDVRNVNGVDVQVQYYFAPGQPVMRALFSFTPGQPPTFGGSTTITIASNFGSDGDTTVRATADGDTVVETTDRWILTSDLAPDTGDPTLLWSRFGIGAPDSVTATPTVPGAGNDNFVDQYQLALQAGQTRRLMVFLRLGTSVADNQAASGQFDSLQTLQAAGLLAGLSPQQLGEIANWAPLGTGGVSFVANVPTVGDFAKWMLLLGVGGLGIVAMRRRRQRA